MPTGYTEIIEKDASFEEFVMGCARAFGACIDMRDNPQGKAIPKFKPTTYYKEQLKDAKKKLAKLKQISLKESEEEADKEYNETIQSAQTAIEKRLKLKEKYLSMLIKVKDWNPPTSDHSELKKFMIKQIENSINFDCDIAYYKEKLKTKMLSGNEWKAKKLAKIYNDIEYYTEEQVKEEERVNRNNKWIETLKNSL